MDWLQISNQYPSIQLSQNELLAEIQVQLRKDLERSACSISFPAELFLDPSVLVAFLLSELQKNKHLDLRALLYVIDLPESWLKEIEGSPNYFVLLTNAILKREAMKVYIRRTYRPEGLRLWAVSDSAYSFITLTVCVKFSPILNK